LHGEEQLLEPRPDPTPPPPAFPALSAESLRWTMGLFCAFIGAFVLVAPHRYTGPLYQGLAPFHPWWGIAALGGGAALLAVAILRPGRAVSLAVHGGTGAMMLALAASFSSVTAWTGAIAYAVLGLGLAAAGLSPAGSSPTLPDAGRCDLFALLMGIVGVLEGGVMLALPRLFHSSYFNPSRRYLPVLGSVLLAAGLLLCRVQLRPAPRWLVWVAHVAAAGAFFLLGLLVSVPGRSWTGITLYFGCGTALALLPWLSHRLARLDTRALRTRLALALATATSAALILTVAVSTTQEERLAAEQALETRKVEAQSIANTVADYVELNAAQTATVAAMAGRTPLEPLPQRILLENTLPLFPRMKGLASVGPGGRVLGAAGDVPLDALNWKDLAAGIARDPRVAVDLLTLPGEELPRLVLSAPVIGPGGSPAAVLVNVLGSDALAQRIARPGSNVYLADGRGRTIARHEGTEPGSGPEAGAARLPEGWDRRVASGEAPELDGLAAFRKVPELGWVVAVERPRSAALAGVRQGRDLAFLLLLAVVPLAVLAGIFTARRIARPLGTLADAVDELTAGNPGAPLSSSNISEVARLSAAFAEMRDRLASRTRESERLAAELRARAEALADSDRRKNEFLAMLAHELRNPLGAIANAAYLLAQKDQKDQAQNLDAQAAERAVAVIQRQIQHLVRLVDDLLDVSRITRGKVELRRERIDFGDAVRHAVETTRPLLDGKSHALRVDLPGEPLPLDADATRLEQVVGNLLRNAAKYTDPGGRIEVLVRREDGEAVLCVNDNGVGIAPDLLPRVFDLFTQGEQALDRSGAGLGIGLTLVRSLVEMHGGRVEAHSDGLGTGCKMEVRLPLADSQGEGAERELSSAIREARTMKRFGAEPT
jgi:signal transduction histidine kinase